VGRDRSRLEAARAQGALDEIQLSMDEAVTGADFVVFCTPVDRIAAQVLEAAPRCAAGTLLTDAGSTKTTIVRLLDGKLPASVHFVGGHPLAGSEKRGAEFAEADLFQDRLTVLTPTEKTDPAALGRVQAFWKSLGGRTCVMSPEEHDRALAVTSHLPHLLASALASILPAELHGLTASGFRDTTRVAAGDPALWSAIFDHNRPALLSALSRLEERLHDFRTVLTTEDGAALHDLLKSAKEVRDALGS
jgi:prephenate dehydrogenase